MNGPVLECDLLIRGGAVVDGTGAPPRRADVAVAGDRILAVGALAGVRAREVIEAEGRAVAPGFIDTHTHDDRALLSDPAMGCKTSQGVTTVVAGNCGVSLAPLVAADRPPPPLDIIGDSLWYRFPSFAAYAETVRREPPAVNAALLVGHQTLRVRHMDRTDREASGDEIAAMRADVAEAMSAGAIGFSTGLVYAPNRAASTAEVIAVAEAAAAAGGLYATHIRNESDQVEAAVEEALEIGRAARLPVVLSHHKAAGKRNFGRTTATLARVDAARHTQPVSLDAYPYVAGSTVLTPEDADKEIRIIVSWSKPHPEVAGRDLADIAAAWGCDPKAAIERLQPAGGIFFMMDEADVQRVLRYPHTMIGSDGLPHDDHPHPRLWGTFTRVLGHYARELGLFSLEEAVRRMTSLPATSFGLADRGVIRPGAYADLVVFDPATVQDRATFQQPKQPSAGIDTVLVNGRPVWFDGKPTGARPGRVLRRTPGVAAA